MTIDAQTPGRPQTYFLKPSDTNENDIYEAYTPAGAVVQGLNYTAGSTGCDVTVSINDGTTTWKIMDAVAVAANTRADVDFGNIHLKNGHKMTVQVSLANEITFALTIAEDIGRQIA